MARLPPSSFAIRTENFLLRPLMRDDACAALESWPEDEGAMEMLNAARRRWSIADQVAYFLSNAEKPSRCLLGIFPNDQKEPIGIFIIKLRAEDSTMLVTHLLGNKEWRTRYLFWGRIPNSVKSLRKFSRDG